MSAHTPGPWTAEMYSGGGFDIESANGSDTEGLLVIASRHGHRNDDTMHANAQLIAAAPDLLEALKLIAFKSGNAELQKIARAAIAKATTP